MSENETILTQLDREAVFSDTTDNFVKHADVSGENGLNDCVYITIRTRKSNTDYINIHYTKNPNDPSMQVETLRFEHCDGFYDYFMAGPYSDYTRLEYYFEIVKDDRITYYDTLGCTNEIRRGYRFFVINGFDTPNWAKGAIMYQIYTDRFFNGDLANDVVDNEYLYLGDYARHAKDWYEYPDKMDVGKFYGGDLQGVIDKLDYLAGLGIEAIYFNPLFVSPSNHKYDTMDYDHIDPHFGVLINDTGKSLMPGDYDNRHATRFISRVTDEENLKATDALFVSLVEKAHEKGIRVIVDGVFNHCGSYNKWLDTEGIYDEAAKSEAERGAYREKFSSYCDYFGFTLDEWPANNSYDKWWGNDTLPKLNYEGSKELEEYILNIGRKWVSPPYNCDGWRLDVAADLGHSEEYNHIFWNKFRQAVKEANPQAVIIAEHYGNPSAWLNGKEWDTVMNYDAFMEPVSWFLTGMEKHSDSYSEQLKGNTEFFRESMLKNMANFPYPSLYTAMNQLSNHDHSRFLTRTNHKAGRVSTLGFEAAGEDINKKVFMQAVVMQMTWPGAPTLYYADEAGQVGFTDPDSRRTYPWGKEDFEILEFYRDMNHLHKRNEVLKSGSLKILPSPNGSVIYERFNAKEKIFVVVNTGCNREITIDFKEYGINEGSRVTRILEITPELYNIGESAVTLSENLSFTFTALADMAYIYKAV